MLRKSSFLLSVAACGTLLASCGGNNTPDPTPTPTSSPTPTPTPTASPTPTNFDFTEDFTANGSLIYIYAYFTPTGEAEVFSDASRLNGTGGISFRVSPENVLYAFADLQEPVEFTGDQLDTATATLRTYVNGGESLMIEKPYTHTLRITYERSDSTIVNTVTGNLRSNRVTLLANPILTEDALANMTYSGLPKVVGGDPGTSLPDYAISQQATFAINATGLTISGTIPIFDDDGVPTQVADLTISGPVTAGGGFVGDVTDDANGFTGRFAGGMVGPNREEMALAFAVTHEDGRKYVGSFIGNQVP